MTREVILPVVVTTSLVCPNCGASVPVDPGYVSWCDECDWNVKPRVPHAEGGRLDRIADALGQRLGDRLAIELLRADELKPRLTPAKVGAYVIALGVHALVLGFAALGLFLLLQDPGAFFPTVGGILLLGLAFVMRPRLGKRPDGVLPRGEAPVTYGLVDEVATAVGTRPPDVIAVTPEYNASWSTTGVRRERVLELGLPLLVALGPQERVALIAHELAHDRHGDATRSFVVGSAIDALAQLYVTLTPGNGAYRASDLDLAELVSRPFVWLVAQPIRLLLLLELHLLLRDSQRTEYLADALAARAAGTAAVVRTHEKLLLDETFRARRPPRGRRRAERSRSRLRAPGRGCCRRAGAGAGAAAPGRSARDVAARRDASADGQANRAPAGATAARAGGDAGRRPRRADGRGARASTRAALAPTGGEVRGAGARIDR